MALGQRIYSAESWTSQHYHCPYSCLSAKQNVIASSAKQKVSLNVNFHTSFQDNSKQDEEKSSKPTGMVTQLMVMVRQFGNGVKQIYYDFKRVRALTSKLNTAQIQAQEAPKMIKGVCDSTHSREELQFLYRVS